MRCIRDTELEYRVRSLECELRSAKSRSLAASVASSLSEFFIGTSAVVSVLWLVANLASCGSASVRYATMKAMDRYASSAGRGVARASCRRDASGSCGRRPPSGFAGFYACSVYGPHGRLELCCDGDASLLNEGCFEANGGASR
jgi:hypothetical protein